MTKANREPPPDDDRFAKELRGFGVLGIIAIVIILLAGNYPFVPLSAILVLVWVRLSRTPWREIGHVKLRSWLVTAVVGIALLMRRSIDGARDDLLEC